MTDAGCPRPSRRAFLASGLALGALAGCAKSPPPGLPPGRITGENVALGHRLRDGGPLPAGPTRRAGVVIVGAGVAGLTAAWRLRDAGVAVELLELGDTPGGTARGGLGLNGPYPLGAHYLPVPNPESAVTRRFLEVIGLLQSHGGALRAEERHLVFDPEDRLFHRGRWDDGLYLRAGAGSADLADLKRFEGETARLRAARGADGRLAFALPTELSSRDPAYVRLDGLTMSAWLRAEGYRSERLRWAIDYACRDDYGAGVDQVSAWAGLHYFAGRRGLETPETLGTHYFTWPEGNAWLVARLLELAGRPPLTTTALVASIEQGPRPILGVLAGGGFERLDCDAVILATPSYVTGRLLGRRPFAVQAPWLVVNLALHKEPLGATDAWNNVAVDSTSVGYVDATHQRLAAAGPPHWTWYEPLPAAERAWLLQADYETLVSRALTDLRRMHPDIDACVARADVWRWGHGTVIPAPGTQFGEERRAFQSGLSPRVALAHTDLGGLPFFEEAQHQGVLAAERVCDALGVQLGSRWG